MLYISAADHTHIQQIGYGLLSVLTEISFSVRAMRTQLLSVNADQDGYNIVHFATSSQRNILFEFESVVSYEMSNNRQLTSAGSHPQVAFEEIEHTADRVLRIYGSNLEELLLNAARGMNSLMVTKHVPCSEHQEKFVELDAMDTESLLVDWLSELAYWAEIEMLVFHEFKIESVSPTHLGARIYGTRVTQLENHIKAVTYHNLDIVQTEKGLTATVVFDV